MLNPATSLQAAARVAVPAAPYGLHLLAAAVAAAALGRTLPAGLGSLALFSVAGTLAALAAALRLVPALARRGAAGRTDTLAAFLANDVSPSFIVDGDGAVVHQNRSAVERFGSRGGLTLARVLAPVFADPGSVLYRLQTRAATLGTASEDLVTRRGHVRLTAHRLDAGSHLWRLEDMAERAIGGRGAESISLPMMTVSKTGTILFMNEALRRILGERVKTLDRVFTELPVRPGEEQDLAGAAGPVRALVAEIEGQGGRREIYLLAARGDAPPRDPAAFENLPVAMLRLDGGGEVRELNGAARKLLGEVALGTPLPDLLEGLGRPVSDWLHDALRGRSENRPEVLRLRARAEECFVQVLLLRSAGAGPAGLVAVLTDVTRMRTLEEQFVQSQKMQAIGQLAGGIAHDFNNLLTAISGHCDLLLLRHDRADPDFADLTQISQNANRAASLVGQLLAFSRKQTLRPAVIDLRDTLADLTHLLNRLVGERLTLTLRHDPDLRPIRADRRQLEQVLMNLVVNARDAMPAGGPIEISTENLSLQADLQRDRATVPAGDYVVVRVSDQGCGIAPDKLQKIFEPFFTTKRPGEGTGLGLSTVYGIVKQTGGFVFCDSVIGQGSVFTLYFPAHDPDEREAELPVATPAAPRVPRAAGGVVLLVEDEAPVRAFAARALRMRGFAVIEAETGDAALAILTDAALKVDIFVTDVVMPGRDGPDWVREALLARPGTRVVFMSGYSEDSLAAERDRVPNAVFLPKPFSLSELTATVQAQLA